MNAVNVTQRCGDGPPRGKIIGVAIPRVTVINVAVALEAVDPLSVTDCGETVQLGPGGATMQLHVTVCFEPFCGVADTVKLACCPAVMVWVNGVAETV
jgi:hypothetical protein